MAIHDEFLKKLYEKIKLFSIFILPLEINISISKLYC